MSDDLTAFSTYFPLHPAQQNVWYDQQVNSDSPKYNIGLYQVIEGAVDLIRLQQAWSQVITTCDALRLAIQLQDDGLPMQQVLPHEKIDSNIPLLDFSTQTNADARAQAWMQEQYAQVFNIEYGERYKVALLKITKTQYYLFFRYHHLYIDGSSVIFSNNKLWAIYQEKAALNTERVMPSPAYRFVAEQAQGYLNSTRYTRDYAYWQKFIQQFAITRLPKFYPQNKDENVFESHLSEQLTRDLRAFCIIHKKSLMSVLLSAMTLYFTRIMNKNELVMSTAVHGRRGRQGMQVVGMHSNQLLVATTTIDDGSDFITLLKNNEEQLKKGIRHGYFPYGHLSRITHGLNTDIGLNYEFHSESVQLHKTYYLSPLSGSRPLDIRWIDFQGESTLRWRINYQQAYFNDIDIKQLCGRLTHLITQCIQQPSIPIRQISVVPEQEYHTLLHQWNKPDAYYPQDKTLSQLFEAQVEATPDHRALVFEEHSLTYQQLNEKANQLARTLRHQYQCRYHRELMPDTLIALYVDRSMAMVISILAVLKAGGAYVPVSPDYPKARTLFILDDTQAALVVTQQHYMSQLDQWVSQHQNQPILIAADRLGSIEGQPADNLPTLSGPNDLAYVIYTSGTTGQPKGVMQPHKNIPRLFQVTEHLFNFSDKDNWLLQHAYTFDVSVWDMWGALLHGGQLMVPDEALVRDVPAMLQYCHRHRISVLNATTAAIYHLTESISAEKMALPSLRFIIFVGERLLNTQLTPWWVNQGYDKPQLVNGYGITETSVFSTFHFLSQQDTIGHSLIGHPFNDTKAYVLNAQQQLVPIGVEGELYLGGAGLARGYLNRPELTAERFIPNPFATAEDIEKGYTRLYRTGDRVRWLPDGNVDYIGRTDFQVKIRGYRIELGEIEEALGVYPEVKQSVVLALEKNDDSHYLAAYVVLSEEGLNQRLSSNAFTECLRVSLNETLPNYMIPAAFVVVGELPLTINGKLDRKALPEPDFHSKETYVAPRSKTEQQLCSIWAEVLGLAQVGIEDNFFRIGGDSLSAVRLCARIREQMNQALPLATLFKWPTIGALSSKLESDYVTIPQLQQDRYPLSFAQQRLWFIEQYQFGSDSYHIPYLVKLHPQADEHQLLEALNAIAQRHPVLNSTYHSTEKGEGYTLLRTEPLAYQHHLIAHENDLGEQIKTDVAQPFEWSTEAPLRLCRYDVKDDRYLLLMWHHIAFDGWSTDIFLKELSECYNALSEQRLPQLPSLSIDYGDYAQWQHTYLQEEVVENLLSYWQNQLVGSEPLALLTDHLRPPEVDPRGANKAFLLDERLSTQLRDYAESQGSTLYTVLLSGFYLLLSRLSGQDDIIIGVPSANRSHPQTQDVIGLFVNSLVLRTQIDLTQDFATLVQQVHQVVTDAKVHQALPFEKLVSALDVERDPSRHPLFQVMFSVQSFGQTQDTLDLPFTHTALEGIDYSPAKFDLSLLIDDGKAQLEGQWNYALSLFEHHTIERFSGMYQRLLKALMVNPLHALNQADMLSTAERHTLINQWNKPSAYYPQDKTLSQLFEAQVEATPNHRALVFEEHSLTYQQLNEKANQLARTLRHQYQCRYHRELMPDTLIALYVDRSMAMVISILAVLKAGGAYVPVSPDYPKARTLFILDDTQTSLVVTQQHYMSQLDQWLSQSQAQPTLIAADTLDSIEDQPADNLPALSGPNDLAYVIYTSGTTGQPKGVMQPHKNIPRLFQVTEHLFNFSDKDNWLLQHAYTFDVSVWEMWGALIYGGQLMIPDEALVQDIPALLQYCHKHSISLLNSTTAVVHRLAESISGNKIELPYLRCIIFGGERLRNKQLNSWWSKQGNEGIQLINTYGITETSIVSTFHFLSKQDSACYSLIGHPFNDTKAYVLNAQQQLVPIGVEGELYLGGAGLARGYVNRPELTAERFIPNPFATAEDIDKGYTHLYRTGDRVRWLPDGNIDYIGRTDFQVKIRGYRIELGEIEEALGVCPEIKQSVVLALEKNDDSHYLAAYVVLSEEGLNQCLSSNAFTEYLRASLSDTLPNYMIPAAFVVVDELPLTINGKLDRKALPEPNFHTKEAYVAPRSKTEQQLCSIWAEVLGLKQVGIEDHFFRIGGDSLSAVRLCARIREQMNQALPLATLFKWPTIDALSSKLESDYIIIPRLQQDRYPLAFAQQRLWFIEQYQFGSDSYHIPYLVKLHPQANESQLLEALNAIAQRHPVLNSTYHSTEKGEGYTLLRTEPLAYQHHLIAHENDLGEQVKADVAQPFEWSTEAPLRLCRYDVKDDRYLLLMWHHIAFDGWSTDIFLKELSEYYNALSEQRLPQLPSLSIDYGDYAQWQQNYLQGEVVENLLSYWQNQLVGSEPLTLLTDHLRPAEVDPRGANKAFLLDERLSTQLRDYAESQGSTLYTVLLSGFYLLLSRLSGQDDIIIGVPSANRSHPQTQDVIGLFVNSLVLRTQIDPTQDFTTLVQQVHQVVTDAKVHQALPFEKLVSALDVERDPSRHPLFQVMFSVQSFGQKQDTLDLPFTHTALDGIDYSPAKFDLSLLIDDGKAQLEGQWNYALSLFKHHTIERFSGMYQRLLKALMANPQHALNQADILSTAERHTLINQWNKPEAYYPQDKTLSQLFEAQVDATPDHRALVFEEHSLTYQQLNEKANQLARTLRHQYQCRYHRELMPDTLIALYVDRSMAMVISILAVLKAGGAYVPVSPDYPKARTLFILDDTQAPLVVTQQHHMSQLDQWVSQSQAQPILIAADTLDSIEGQLSDNLPALSGPNDLAYVIYTSGTTGQPKGVMQPHKNIPRLFQVTEHLFNFSDKDNWLFQHAYTFDVSVWEMWGALIYGGQLMIPDEALVQDIPALLQYCHKHSISLLNSTTAVVHRLAESISGNKIELPYLRCIIFGGERLRNKQLNSWWSKQGNEGIRLINTYGITETSIVSTFHFLSKQDSACYSLIGHPFNDSKAYVLNAQQQLVPIGVEGELYLGGAGLARGYVNRPELTAERFIPNPFATAEDIDKGYTHLYRTGDRVRWLPDGNIDYIGRTDFQVKIRGYRIELGEIEEALGVCPEVKQSVVLALEKNDESHYLAAYVVLSEEGLNQRLSSNAVTDYLRASLSDTLPNYMIPAVFVVLGELPLTINGKLDRKALPEPDFHSKETYVAPRSKTEQQLCSIWAEVLGLAQMGIEDHFFRIGGDSLSAVRLCARIREQMNQTLPLATLFKWPTIGELSSKLENDYVTIPQLQQDRYPLSFAQQRLWFIEQYQFGSDSYHIPYLVKLHPQADESQLLEALNAIAQRHPVLNSTYHSTEKGEGYTLLRTEPLAYQHHLISHENDLREQVKADVAQPFEWSTEAPLRLCRYDVKDDRYLLLMWHHIAFDGWSTDIFLKELSECYNALSEQRLPQLPSLSIDYGDYAQWQDTYLQGEVVENLLSYWQKQLVGSEPLTLLTDHLRPAEVDPRGANKAFLLDERLSTQLRDYAESQGSTLYTVLLSGFYLLLSRLSGQDDIIIGVPSANRSHPQTQDVIGLFVNSLVLRTQIDPTQDFATLVKQVHQVVTDAKVHQALPFEKLVSALDVERDPSRHPLFQVMFSVQSFGQTQDTLDLPFTHTTLEGIDYSPAKFDLSLLIDDGKAQLEGQWNYALSLFEHNSIERFSGMYQRLLKALMVNPLHALNQADMLSTAERHTLINQWNKPKAYYPQDKTLSQLFEAQVDATPDHRALVFEEHSLTYQQLNEKANQLARTLRQQYQCRYHRELMPDTLIALYVDRSMTMVISILAILKAGGAYVPVSPDYPKARTLFILDDTQAPLVVTQQHYMSQLDQWLSQSQAQPTLVAADTLDSIEGQPADNLPAFSGPNDLAYVIYTSGTTGQPKGVMQPHKNIPRLFQVTEHLFNFSDKDNWLLQQAYTFDFSLWDMWGALLHGGQLMIPDEALVRDVSALLQYCHLHRISIFNQTTNAFYRLTEHILSTKTSLPYLRCIIFGGERLRSKQLTPWWVKQGDQGLQLVNAYGITETSIISTFHFLSKQDSAGHSLIGHPFNDLKAYVLNAQQQLVPIGVEGELYLGGAGLARGYLNRPELTAERFIPNPFATAEDIEKGYTRLYRTGDRVRWLPDGNIDYIGRTDFQVKIRGYRIELGEIEEALGVCPEVKQSVVLALEKNDDSHYLAAYVVLSEEGLNQRLSSNAVTDYLRASLSDTLPNYMIPAVFVVLGELPLTINGKLDRKALPEPDFHSKETYVAPRTKTEQQLCSIWAEVLGLEQVGIEDNFFRMGGDSIISIQLISRLCREGFMLQVKDIFEAPTIAQLITRLNEDETVTINAEQGVLQGSFDLLPIQQWFFSKPLVAPHHFNQAFVQRIPAEITFKNIEQACSMLACHHDMLRVHYQSTVTGWKQTYHEQSTMAPLISLNRQGMSDETLQETLSVYQQGFDVIKGPLWCVIHMNGCNDGEARLVFMAHHLIIDGVSWRILADDMALLLRNQTLLPKSSSYRQWVEGVEDYATKQQAQYAYWQAITDISMAWPEPVSLSHHTLKWNKTLTARLMQSAPKGYHTEINDLLLSALAIALHATFDRTCSTITLEGHGRETIAKTLDISRTVGWFTTMYPVMLEQKSTPEATIIHTKEMLRGIVDHGLGYGLLMQANQQQSLLPPISFNYLGQFNNARSTSLWQLTNEPMGCSMSPDNSSELLLNINGCVQQGILEFHISSQLSPVQTHTFLETFKQAMVTIIDTACDRATQGGLMTPSDFMKMNQKPWIEYNRHPKVSETLIVFPLKEMGYEMWLNTLIPEIPSNIHLVLFDTDKVKRFDSFDEWAEALTDILLQEELSLGSGCSVLGWSFGAVLAYLVASKLSARGVVVNQTMLMDPLVEHLITGYSGHYNTSDWYKILHMPYTKGRLTVYQCTESDATLPLSKHAVASDGLGFKALCDDVSVIKVPCKHHQMLSDPTSKKIIIDSLRQKLCRE